MSQVMKKGMHTLARHSKLHILIPVYIFIIFYIDNHFFLLPVFIQDADIILTW